MRKILQERRYDIDGLRILAMLMVFLFHCARFLAAGGGISRIRVKKASLQRF
jgi:peptidoglycan/LPS O-acetylase OafA/YrhL